jgi:predicted ATPase
MTEDTVPGLGNLPAEPNSFVGRERDLGDLTLLLSNVRALTLCGPAGIGKSRLATRLGWQLADTFPDGIWFAELADHGDPVHAVRRVADVLGVSEEPDRSVAATLVDALDGRELLLILDTCEHVVEAIADLVSDLISGCPLIRVVATSREPLRVRGETVWRVPPRYRRADRGRVRVCQARCRCRAPPPPVLTPPWLWPQSTKRSSYSSTGLPPCGPVSR